MKLVKWQRTALVYIQRWNQGRPNTGGAPAPIMQWKFILITLKIFQFKTQQEISGPTFYYNIMIFIYYEILSIHVETLKKN